MCLGFRFECIYFWFTFSHIGDSVRRFTKFFSFWNWFVSCERKDKKFLEALLRLKYCFYRSVHFYEYHILDDIHYPCILHDSLGVVLSGLFVVFRIQCSENLIVRCIWMTAVGFVAVFPVSSTAAEKKNFSADFKLSNSAKISSVETKRQFQTIKSQFKVSIIYPLFLPFLFLLCCYCCCFVFLGLIFDSHCQGNGWNSFLAAFTSKYISSDA